MDSFELPILSYFKNFQFFNWNKKGKIPNHKKKIIRHNMLVNFNRFLKMFKWGGLPDTVPQRILEIIIMTNGFGGGFEFEDKKYFSFGTLGGIPNENYMPSKMIISNPYIKGFNFKSLDIYGDNKEVVVIPNDDLYMGVLPILSYHCELITEIELTKRATIINDRLPNVLVASDDNAKKDIDDLLSDVEDGEISSVADRNLYKESNSIPFGECRSSNLATQIIELLQYQKASLLNDMGLQANYNMKRESLTSSENLLNTDALLPLSDNMYDNRKIGAEELSDFWHTKISVEFGSAWKRLRDNLNADLKAKSMSTGDNPLASENEVHLNGVDKNEEISSDNNIEKDKEIVSNEQEAVEVLEPIIEGVKEVIQELGGNENNEEETN